MQPKPKLDCSSAHSGQGEGSEQSFLSSGITIHYKQIILQSGHFIFKL